MATDMLGKWKQDFSNVLPLQNLGDTLSGWRYAPVGDTEAQQSGRKSWSARIRETVASKTFWRLALVFAILLLLANLFSPAKSALDKYGWIDTEHSGEKNAEAAPASPDHEAVPSQPPADTVDWSQYAYCQYVTNEAYLCNSMMIFESLVRLGAKAERLMMYPEQWVVGDDGNAGRLLAKARDEYGVRLMPISVQHFDGEMTWADSFTKLLAFNQTEYKRVLSLDSDATVLQPMDELFLLPSAPVAMPRAYWLENEHTLSSQLVLVEPSHFEFNRIQEAFAHRSANDFDMEIVNQLYGDSCFIIPHRRYDLLTGEFRSKDHYRYLGSKQEVWDPDKVFEEAKFLHFSDWPLPKPWLPAPPAVKQDIQPKCVTDAEGREDCRDRERWLWIYRDFTERREKVCGSAFARREVVKRGVEVFEPEPPSRWEPIF